jgi:hypothetical protein
MTTVNIKNINTIRNNNNDDDNINITCVSNAIILTSISYQVDNLKATNLLVTSNNNVKGSAKKRGRNTKLNDNNFKVSVFIDKIDEGFFVIPNYNTNADENEEIVLKPLKEYTIYADEK